MHVLVKALRPTVAGGSHHDPGAEFYLEEADAVILEGKGVVERIHSKGPPENKMASAPENKAFVESRTFAATDPIPRKPPQEIKLGKTETPKRKPRKRKR